MMDRIRILLLEDSALDADLTLASLRKGGLDFTVCRVETRDAFLAALQRERVDLILADFALPDFDGASALDIALERAPDTPFIFVSGVLGEDVAVEMLQRGATDYVIKQRLDRLIPAVRRALREARERAQRQRAEAELRESEQRYRVLVESVREYALLMLDVESRITTWNSGAGRLFGYTPQEVQGQDFGILFAPEERAAGLSLAALQKSEAQGRAEERFSLVRKDGRKFSARGMLMPVRRENEAVSGFVAVLRDNTDIERAEQERQRLFAVERARSEELARAKAEFEMFAHASSHDLLEPLRMVKSFSQLLKRRYGDKLDADAAEFLDYIAIGVDRIHSLIQDLMSFLRTGYPLDSGPKMADLDVALRNALVYLHSSINEAGAEIEHTSMPTVPADGAQIEQVFQNLIGNAIKFRNSKPPRITISAEREGDHWVFRVRDNGTGFDPGHAEQIFELFRRLHNAADYPGTGVGLAICKRIVQHHGGRIWAESTPGGGATFSFTLPVERVRI